MIPTPALRQRHFLHADVVDPEERIQESERGVPRRPTLTFTSIRGGGGGGGAARRRRRGGEPAEPRDRELAAVPGAAGVRGT